MMRIALSFIIATLAVGCGARIAGPDPGASSEEANDAEVRDPGAPQISGEDAAVTSMDTAPPSSLQPRPDAAADAVVSADAAPTADAAPIATRCPLSPPPHGQACLATSGIYDDNFYCHYFASPSACSNPIKCSNTKFYVVGSEDCSFKATACVAGAPCGRVVERDGACIVACERVCQCGTDGKLRCSPITC